MAESVTLGVAEAERWVFVPEMPTPNGRLHLGHMSGPYLKADILARYLRQRGAEAYIVSGSDSYESHVDLAAAQTGRNKEDVANEFHKKIAGEYEALGIRMDLYLNPLDPEINDEYMAANRHFFEQLKEGATTATLAEKVLYSTKADRHIAGCWLRGKCPSCGATSGSYLCEACGTEYSPQDVLEVWQDPELEPWELRNVPTRFMRLKDVGQFWRHLALSGVPAPFTRIVDAYLRERGDKVRLTNPGGWGIPSGVPGQVLFTYTALYFFSAYCCDVLARRQGWEIAPFRSESTTLTIGSFGIDNAVPYLVSGVALGLELPDHKPFDYLLTNYFYQLEGKKFSTSRKHVVCASDLVRAGVNTDLLRYYLAKVTPEFGPRSFVVSEFLESHHSLQRIWGAELSQALRLAEGAEGPADEAWCAGFDDALLRQERALAFPLPSTEACVEALDEWLRRGESARASDGPERSNAVYWWLAGLSVLALPLMPRLARKLWSHLGLSGEPEPMRIGAHAGRVKATVAWEPFVDVSLSMVEECVSREQERTR